MGIVDEKGRIFGRLNIVDLIVVLLIVAAVAALGIKLTSRGGGLVEPTKLTYTVKVVAVEPEVYQSVLDNIPGQLMASGSLVDGQVVAVDATPAKNGASLNTVGGALDVTLRDDLLDLVFTIEANVTNTVINEVGTQEVRIGKSHIVKTAKFEMPSGVILTCDWEAKP
ncbi:hypothetical protein SDC9_132667 [bioreactor metagenome]|uniref:DUF4330 domain-containing protein n=1 Tax=bioreactor metagenome TaxID=1076179 RepID=A0A645D879_9ZZZZ